MENKDSQEPLEPGQHDFIDINYRGLGTGHISGRCKLCGKYIDTKKTSEAEIREPCPGNPESQDLDHIVDINKMVNLEAEIKISTKLLAEREAERKRADLLQIELAAETKRADDLQDDVNLSNKENVQLKRLIDSYGENNFDWGVLGELDALEERAEAAEAAVKELQDDVNLFNKGWAAAQNGEPVGDREDVELQGWQIFDYDRLAKQTDETEAKETK